MISASRRSEVARICSMQSSVMHDEQSLMLTWRQRTGSRMILNVCVCVLIFCAWRAVGELSAGGRYQDHLYQYMYMHTHIIFSAWLNQSHPEKKDRRTIACCDILLIR